MATIAEMKEIMLEIGIDEAVVRSLDATKTIASQGVDSLDWPAFVVTIEEKYGVTISDSDALKLKTLDDFVSFVTSKH